MRRVLKTLMVSLAFGALMAASAIAAKKATGGPDEARHGPEKATDGAEKATGGPDEARHGLNEAAGAPIAREDVAETSPTAAATSATTAAPALTPAEKEKFYPLIDKYLAAQFELEKGRQRQKSLAASLDGEYRKRNPIPFDPTRSRRVERMAAELHRLVEEENAMRQRREDVLRQITTRRGLAAIKERLGELRDEVKTAPQGGAKEQDLTREISALLLAQRRGHSPAAAPPDTPAGAPGKKKNRFNGAFFNNIRVRLDRMETTLDQMDERLFPADEEIEFMRLFLNLLVEEEARAKQGNSAVPSAPSQPSPQPAEASEDRRDVPK